MNRIKRWTMLSISALLLSGGCSGGGSGAEVAEQNDANARTPVVQTVGQPSPELPPSAAGSIPANGAGADSASGGKGPSVSAPDSAADSRPADTPARPGEFDESDWPVYDGPIEHIFFHPLIVFPELAFDGDRMSQGYRDWFVTVAEFKSILQKLYENDYMLVDLASLFDISEKGGAVTVGRKPLRLPAGKKPLVLSIDDLNYYRYMIENGNAIKLVLDENGEVAALTVSPDGVERVARDAEIVPILDDFVREHPDFSLHNAKGVIALTGYEGILGYRTNETESPNFETEKTEALKIVKRLKETGWSFASHGYGHLDARKVSLERLVQDTERWKREVEPLTGPTPIYIYPYGSRPETGSDKFNELVDAGFRILCSVGPSPYLKVIPGAAMMDRRHIDGIALETQRSRLLPLFDANDVIDPIRAELFADAKPTSR